MILHNLLIEILKGYLFNDIHFSSGSSEALEALLKLFKNRWAPRGAKSFASHRVPPEQISGGTTTFIQ